MKHFSNILIRPIVTEKMTSLQETQNKYAFEIPPGINKIDVKKAVEQKFNCLLYTSPRPRDLATSRMPAAA